MKDALKYRRAYKNRVSTYIFAGIILVILLAFLALCIQTGNSQIVMTIIDGATTLALGAIFGYYYGRNRSKKRSRLFGS